MCVAVAGTLCVCSDAGWIGKYSLSTASLINVTRLVCYALQNQDKMKHTCTFVLITSGPLHWSSDKWEKDYQILIKKGHEILTLVN